MLHAHQNASSIIVQSIRKNFPLLLSATRNRYTVTTNEHIS